MSEDKELLEKLGRLLKARFPYIYISTWEEERAVEMISSVAHDPEMVKTVRKVFTWTQTSGWVDENGKQIKQSTDPVAAIQFVQSVEEDAVFVFKDFHVYFGVRNRPTEYCIIRKLRDIVPTLKNGVLKKM